jgi:DNA-binding transcriptional MerR regulator
MSEPQHPDSPSIPDFQDGKDAEALRTIGEVGKALGIKAHVLRYWEEQFPMLRPLTRAGGRRYYRPEDVALLVRIDRLLNREGYTIKGARTALQGRKRAENRDVTAPVAPASQAVAIVREGQPEDQIVEALRLLRAHMEAIRERLAQGLSLA